MTATSTEVAIATTTLGSAASTITFSSIPSTYTDLRLVLVAKGNFNGVSFRLNSDTGSNYSMTRLDGDGVSATSFRLTNQTQINSGPISVPTSATNPLFISFDIFSYAGSTNKTWLRQLSYDNNGSGDTSVLVGLWRNTAAVNTITLSNMGGGNYDAGTTATLYGIL